MSVSKFDKQYSVHVISEGGDSAEDSKYEKESMPENNAVDCGVSVNKALSDRGMDVNSVLENTNESELKCMDNMSSDMAHIDNFDEGNMVNGPVSS